MMFPGWHLAMSGDISVVPALRLWGKDYEHSAGKGQVYCQTSYNTQGAPPTPHPPSKDYLAQNASGAKAEKPWDVKICPSNSPISLERLGMCTTSYNLTVENDFFFSWLVFEPGEYLECGGVVQSPRHVWLFKTAWIVACQSSLSLTISQSLLKLMSIESVIPSNHLSTCYLLLLLPSIFLSNRVFSI